MKTIGKIALLGLCMTACKSNLVVGLGKQREPAPQEAVKTPPEEPSSQVPQEPSTVPPVVENR